jgi:hypothetical protein
MTSIYKTMFIREKLPGIMVEDIRVAVIIYLFEEGGHPGRDK